MKSLRKLEIKTGDIVLTRIDLTIVGRPVRVNDVLESTREHVCFVVGRKNRRQNRSDHVSFHFLEAFWILKLKK